MKNQRDKKYSLVLDQEQIGILKAAIEYYLLDNDFGGAIWMTMPGAGWGSSDDYYKYRAFELKKLLNKVSKVMPNFSWGDIKRVEELMDKEYKIAKREGERAEERMYKESLRIGKHENKVNKIKI